MITTVIFDMDGVIIDSEPIHQRLEFEMFKELGLSISDAEHKTYVGSSSMDMWNRIKQKHQLNKTPEELLLYGREKYWQALDAKRIPLVTGSQDLIVTLNEKGFVVQVASSATRPTVDKVISHFQLQKYIAHRIGGDEVKKSKPDPEIFVRAAEQSNSNPSECIVIEDSTNGVKAAKSAGMKCIAYRNPGTGAQDLTNADLVVSNLNELTIDVIQAM